MASDNKATGAEGRGNTTPVAALASLANSGSSNSYLIWYNDSTTAQLYGITQPYSNADTPFDPPVVSATIQGTIPSGNITSPSALASTRYQGTLNVYGVLNATTMGQLLVCRLSPGFTALNISPPITSAMSLAACSDGKSNGFLFFLGSQSASDVELYTISLPGDKQSPTIVSISLGFNANSYLGAAFGVIGKDSTPRAYCVLQDSKGMLHLVSSDVQIQKQISGTSVAMKNTPIGCIFLDTTLVVYWFNPADSGTTGAPPLMRGMLSDTGASFSITQVANANLPNSFTQLTAFVKPSSLSGDGKSGTVLITYMQQGSDQISTTQDSFSTP